MLFRSKDRKVSRRGEECPRPLPTGIFHTYPSISPPHPPPSLSQGYLSQRFCCYRLSHQKPWHVIRVRICLCEKVQGLHPAQLWFREMSQGMGDQTATAYKQVSDRVSDIFLPSPPPATSPTKTQGTPHAALARGFKPTAQSCYLTSAWTVYKLCVSPLSPQMLMYHLLSGT